MDHFSITNKLFEITDFFFVECTEYQKNCAGKTVSFIEVSGDAESKEFPFVVRQHQNFE